VHQSSGLNQANSTWQSAILFRNHAIHWFNATFNCSERCLSKFEITLYLQLCTFASDSVGISDSGRRRFSPTPSLRIWYQLACVLTHWRTIYIICNSCFNMKNPAFWPRRRSMCFVGCLYTTIMSLFSLNDLLFVLAVQCVVFGVWFQSSDIILAYLRLEGINTI
jgi:hypothetical protein